MSDQFQLDPQQCIAVSIINLEINQLNAAAFECSQPHINIPEVVSALKYAASKLEDAKMAWLRDTQNRVKLATPAIPSKLELVTH